MPKPIDARIAHDIILKELRIRPNVPQLDDDADLTGLFIATATFHYELTDQHQNGYGITRKITHQSEPTEQPQTIEEVLQALLDNYRQRKAEHLRELTGD